MSFEEFKKLIPSKNVICFLKSRNSKFVYGCLFLFSRNFSPNAFLAFLIKMAPAAFQWPNSVRALSNFADKLTKTKSDAFSKFTMKTVMTIHPTLSHFFFLMNINEFPFTGDGLIKLHELKAVLKACIEENGMKFSEAQVEQLAVALYEDAHDCSEELDNRPDNGLTYTELKAQMAKHPGLLENLSIRSNIHLF